MSCEKIATLGDCYYCVSGCPEPREDHAKSCVLMGLAMISAIEEFDADNKEEVDMRVGVHSGSVNCGIVGTRKFKFDIFSNDVTLANKMESTGKPGYVHITETTHSLLKTDEFHFEEGSPYSLPSKGLFLMN
jgi:adenylate cyclase 9